MEPTATPPTTPRTPSIPPASKLERFLYLGILICILLALLIGSAIVKVQRENPSGPGQKIFLTDPAGGSPIPFEYDGTITPQYDEGPTPLPMEDSLGGAGQTPFITPESP